MGPIKTRVGEQSPDLSLKDLHGNPVILSSFRGNKHVVLAFGSTSCGLFTMKLDDLQRVYEQYRQHPDVAFFVVYQKEAHPIMMGTGQPKTQERRVELAKRFQDKYRLEMPVLVDDMSNQAAKFTRLPSTAMIVDKDGRVRYEAMLLHPCAIEQTLQQLLRQE
ncbi:MAG: deiodinase-like protein [Aquabacterium sp.]|uniref:TlpA family protein disulfide reductase n=1 Tax=Aquabacterium sp. TaxID=1872578 RepID=UPI003BB1E732